MTAVNNSSECGKALTKLLKKLRQGAPPDGMVTDVPEAVLVQSYLLWETTADKARTGYDKLMSGIVDFNDLRVTLPSEMVELLGVRYPNVEERAERLRATLRDLYNREHSVKLGSLHEAGKRDVKKYIESLDGIPPYVAARVQLVAFGAHAIPVDEQLREALMAEGAADESADVVELSNWLTRQIKASDALGAHYALQRWVDRKSGRRRSSTSRRTKTKTKTKTSRKTKRKTRSRAATG